MLKKWTKNEIEHLKILRIEGRPLGEIATILERPYTSVASMSSKLVKRGEVPSRKPRGCNEFKPRKEYEYLSKDELLEEVIKYISKERAPYYIRNRVMASFGTWTQALETAGISGNIGGKFVSSRVTRLYLLKFEEGFYKVGVTQQQIKSRFSGAPSYEILDYLETDLDNAVYLEKELKKSVKSYQYVAEHPWFERNGKTECFKTDRPIRQLEDIFDL